MEVSRMLYVKPRVKELLEGGIVFIDPGLGGTGWAYWPEINTSPKKAVGPSQWDVIKMKGERWENCAWSIATAMAGVFSAVKPSWVVMEYPELFSGSVVSQAAVAKGDLGKLWYLCGMIGLEAGRLTGKIPVLVTPGEWKGQLPKEEVTRRVIEAFGDGLDFTRDHVCDATAMGLAAQGGL